ncbi:unnamed protein product [Symbiodinium sp. CCMP2592]|nr:unnamed protein product [Symbiodinium sp. CCMP2592]
MWQTLPFALSLVVALLPTATADGTGTFTVVPPTVASLRGRSIPIREDGVRLLEIPDAVEPMDTSDASGLMLNHVVSHFFRDVEAVNSQKGRPMRLQVVSASLTILIYAMIVRRSLLTRPGSRSVIFVPKVSVAKEVCKELETCHLRTNLISGKDVRCDPTADVTVCLANRADCLLGQHFHVKLVDCADRLQLPGVRWKNIHKDVTADMCAEFSTCFSGIEVDHDYTLTCAVSGRTALPGSSLRCFLRPLTKVASHWAGVVRLMRTSCAGSPTVLVFTRVERARQCAEQLCAGGIPASSLSAADGTGSRRRLFESFGSGELRALCVTNKFFKRADFPPMETVVLADPNFRQDACRQLAARALELSDQKCGPTRLIHAFDADASDEELERNARRVIDPMEGLGSAAEWRLLTASGSSAPFSEEEMWSLLQEEGRSKRRKMERDWLIRLCMWLRDNGRVPQKRAGSPEERLMASRWLKANAHLRKNQFSKVEVQLFKDASAQLRAGMVKPRSVALRGWMQSLRCWMSLHQKRPSSISRDVLEKKHHRRLAHSFALLRAGKLSEAEARWLRNCEFAQLEKPSTPTWLISLAAWMRYYERKPRKNASGHEKLQGTRLQKAMQMLRSEQLSTAERLLLTDSLDWLEEVEGRPSIWLCGLYAWVRAHGRTPRFVSDDMEHLQAGRWKHARKLWQMGALRETEERLVAECKDFQDKRKDMPKLEEGPRIWLCDLYAWVRAHGRTPQFVSDDVERLQAGRWKHARKRWQLGTLRSTEERLVERCKDFQDKLTLKGP